MSKTPIPTISANKARKAPRLSVELYWATSTEQLAEDILVAIPHTTLAMINMLRFWEKTMHSQLKMAGKPDQKKVRFGPNLPPQ